MLYAAVHHFHASSACLLAAMLQQLSSAYIYMCMPPADIFASNTRMLDCNDWLYNRCCNWCINIFYCFHFSL